MFTLSVLVCLASNITVECKAEARIYPSRTECILVGRAYLQYIKASKPLYVTAVCKHGGLT